MDWGEAPIRIFVAGLALMAACSALLGVLTGWWLRGREVRRLEGKVAYLREELRKAWSRKVTRIDGHGGKNGGGGNGKAG
jgi:hypothetical protein